MSRDLRRTLDLFDVEADRAELGPGSEDTVFARLGAGDLALAVLGAAPKVIVAAGATPPDTHLFELKLAALKALSLAEALELLGARPSRRRGALYQRVRWLLPPESDAWWRSEAGRVERGLLGSGEVERALAGFRRFTWLAVGAAKVERFLELGSIEEQRDALARDWSGFLWRTFADRVLGAAWPGMTRQRLERAMASAPAREQWVLQWLLAGRWTAARPSWLREDAFDALKPLANRVIVVHDAPERALAPIPDGAVDVFALGLGPIGPELAAQVERAGRAGARVTLRGPGLPARCVEIARTARRDRSIGPEELVAATLLGEVVCPT
jgi:S-adenosylmethionine:diacylglycerol 3-amino-3-carboxypropyl transferase